VRASRGAVLVCVCMNDLVDGIVEQLEPSQPLGYRLVILSICHDYALIFEAKAVPFKGALGFMVRHAKSVEWNESLPAMSELQQAFAPSEDALKHIIRYVMDMGVVEKETRLVPPGETWDDVMKTVSVDFGHSAWRVGDKDSHTERVLQSVVAALTVMELPVGIKAWWH